MKTLSMVPAASTATATSPQPSNIALHLTTTDVQGKPLSTDTNPPTTHTSDNANSYTPV